MFTAVGSVVLELPLKPGSKRKGVFRQGGHAADVGYPREHTALSHAEWWSDGAAIAITANTYLEYTSADLSHSAFKTITFQLTKCVLPQRMFYSSDYVKYVAK